MNPLRWSFRRACIAGFVMCVLLVAYAWSTQIFQGLTPCLLCWCQRFSFWLVALGFALGALHAPASRWRWAYTGIAVLGCLFGIAFAARQLYLQSLPAGSLHTCLPPLSYIVQNFSPLESLQMILRGSADCAVIHWRFLGLTMPGWTLVWYVLLGAWALWSARSRGTKNRRRSVASA